MRNMFPKMSLVLAMGLTMMIPATAVLALEAPPDPSNNHDIGDIGLDKIENIDIRDTIIGEPIRSSFDRVGIGMLERDDHVKSAETGIDRGSPPTHLDPFESIGTPANDNDQVDDRAAAAA